MSELDFDWGDEQEEEEEEPEPSPPPTPKKKKKPAESTPKPKRERRTTSVSNQAEIAFLTRKIEEMSREIDALKAVQPETDEFRFDMSTRQAEMFAEDVLHRLRKSKFTAFGWREDRARALAEIAVFLIETAPQSPWIAKIRNFGIEI